MAAILAEPPDAVILGNTRGMDGLELCRRLRADGRTAGMPVLLITSGGTTDRVLALESGADDSLARPFGLRAPVGLTARHAFGGRFALTNPRRGTFGDVADLVEADAHGGGDGLVADLAETEQHRARGGGKLGHRERTITLALACVEKVGAASRRVLPREQSRACR